jgi:carbamoyltransferase
MTHAYYGPSMSEADARRGLEKRGLDYERVKDVSSACADLLADGRIVGWVQGRMEGGPRALGGRSILADPRRASMKDQVNLKVKFREPWRPFCPSLLDEAREDYLLQACSAPFMILTFTTPASAEREIPAVVHVDRTTRPQTVERAVNPLYWKLLRRFGDSTGTPVLLNTSFNVKGEPIVNTPAEAIDDFLKTGMDALAIGDLLVTKEGLR